MRLARLEQYHRLKYAPGARSIKSLRKDIDAQRLPGGLKEGGRYYVDLDVADQHDNLRIGLTARLDELRRSEKLAGLT